MRLRLWLEINTNALAIVASAFFVGMEFLWVGVVIRWGGGVIT